MKIVVVGAGAVGAYFGGRLAQHGEDVTFLVRQPTAEVLERQGLRVESIRGDFLIPHPKFACDAEAIGAAAIVLVAVKAWQVAAVARQIKPLVGPGTYVIPMQNGIDAGPALTAVLGERPVMGGMCRILSHQVEKGWIRHTGSEPDIHFGPFDGRHCQPLFDLQQRFEKAGVVAKVHDDISSVLWRKFLFVVTLGSVGSLIRAPIGIVRGHPETRELLLTCLRENHALARAHGVLLPDESIGETMNFIDGLPPAGISSMQRDLAAGRPSELEAWTGAVVRRGREKGVPTPLHHLIYHCLLPFEKQAQGELTFPE